MTQNLPGKHEVEVHPATAERWKDIEALFGLKGAFAGCWCMYWRVERAEFNKLKGDGTKAALKEITLKNQVPGLLAYQGGQPIGWCSVGPRTEYAALERSRRLRRIDDAPVWSIVCFFIAKPYRAQGLQSRLLRAAVGYAREHGAQVIEGYPIDLGCPKLAGKRLRSCSGCMGIASVFRAAGFEKVGQASETQLIMRTVVKDWK